MVTTCIKYGSHGPQGRWTMGFGPGVPPPATSTHTGPPLPTTSVPQAGTEPRQTPICIHTNIYAPSKMHVETASQVAKLRLEMLELYTSCFSLGTSAPYQLMRHWLPFRPHKGTLYY